MDREQVRERAGQVNSSSVVLCVHEHPHVFVSVFLLCVVLDCCLWLLFKCVCVGMRSHACDNCVTTQYTKISKSRCRRKNPRLRKNCQLNHKHVSQFNEHSSFCTFSN